MERGLQITEEVLRHLVTRVERPAKAGRPDDEDIVDDTDLPSGDDEIEDYDEPSGSTNPRPRSFRRDRLRRRRWHFAKR